MERSLVLNAVLLVVLGITLLGLWLGRTRRRPPGQQGIACTQWQRSKGLRGVQMLLLGLLASGCLVALLIVNF